MIEKVGHVRNPLTIIAIFAALAEVGGTAVLPLLAPVTQYIYVWFLIFFPIGLVGTFFYVLYHKHHVLYAPSDFKEDSAFLDLLEPKSALDRIEAQQKEIELTTTSSQDEDPEANDESISTRQVLERDYRGKYLLAEELAMAKLVKDRGLNIKRNVGQKGKSDGGFDGAASTDAYDVIIEITYARRNWMSLLWKQKLHRVEEFYARLEESRKSKFRVLYVIVYDHEDEEMIAPMMARIDGLASALPFPVEIVAYCYESLSQEFKLR